MGQFRLVKKKLPPKKQAPATKATSQHCDMVLGRSADIQTETRLTGIVPNRIAAEYTSLGTS